MIISRRNFLIGIAAPAIIRVADIMRIKEWREDFIVSWYQTYPGANFQGRGLLIEASWTNKVLRESCLSTEDLKNGWYHFKYACKNMTNLELQERLNYLPPSDQIHMAQIEEGDFT
jgi:hypothetical protein